MASIAEIQRILEQIRDELPTLINNSQVAPNQVVIVNGLSDLSERLGLVQAGEFRVGNSVEPGLGFTGVRIGYPAFTYAGSTWHIAGISNDVIQFGLRATDGKAMAGGGSVVLDEDGLKISETGDSVTLQDTANKRYGVFSMRPAGLSVLVYTVQTETNQISNGDFETGDLTGWTETDPGSKISITQTDRGYSLLFAQGSGSSNFLTQNLAAASGTGAIVTLRIKSPDGGTTLVVGTPTALQTFSIPPDDIWRNITVILTTSVSSLKLYVSNPNSNVYVDDVIVRITASDQEQNLIIGSSTTAINGFVSFNSAQVYIQPLSIVGGATQRPASGLHAAGGFFIDGVASESVAGTYTDYTSTNLERSAVWRFNTTSAVTLNSLKYSDSISGVASTFMGKIAMLINVGANNLTLKDESAVLGTAEWRFALGGSDLVIAAGKLVALWYDGTTERWRKLFST